MANNVKDEKRSTEEAFLGRLLNSIDAYESTEWENETKNVSTNIREALSAQLEGMRGDACNKKFLDYCNCVKSLLAVYNFGKLPTEKDLRAVNAPKQEIDACKQNTEKDKKLIKDGVQKIIEHVQSTGFDITPYLDDKECLQIFGDGEKKITVPVTISATTVMTTLVYFRRACKRQGLYSDAELGVSDDLIDSITSDQTFLIKATDDKDKQKEEAGDEDTDKRIVEQKAALAEKVKDLHDCVAFVIAKILYLFAAFIDTRSVEDKYIGWGFSLNTKRTQAVTLSDTYAVVDAISRFDDAFNQDDETKRDQIFLDKVLSFGECIGFSGSLIEFSLNS
ncbi:MAG: hypothetical protein K2M48_04590, partial [Clostridiales bacterium]|nr:hypothetical protein [Clostridiales bacterium]